MNDIPRGIEVLVKKAAVDPAFRQLLLEKRAEAAKIIGLELRPSEIAMLAGIPRQQLETIINETKVESKLRPILMGTAAAVMLVALGAYVTRPHWVSHGTRPVEPPGGQRGNANPSSKNQAVAPAAPAADTDAVTKPPPAKPRPDDSRVIGGIQPF